MDYLPVKEGLLAVVGSIAWFYIEYIVLPGSIH